MLSVSSVEHIAWVMPLFGTKKEGSKKCPKKEKEEGKMPSVEDKYVLKDLLGT